MLGIWLGAALLDGVFLTLGLGSAGAPGAKDSCRSEQTSRASTPAARRREQKSCAPSSREPFRDLAASRKSSLSITDSRSSGSSYYTRLISIWEFCNPSKGRDMGEGGICTLSRCSAASAQSARFMPRSVMENLARNRLDACWSPFFKDSVRPYCDRLALGFKYLIILSVSSVRRDF